MMTYGKGILPRFQWIPEMQVWMLVLILVHLPSACLLPETPVDSVSCTEDLGCRLLVEDGLCTQGEAVPMPERDPVLVPIKMQTKTMLRCQQERDCIPCIQVMLHLGLMGAKQDGRPVKGGVQSSRHHKEFLRTHIWLSAQTYPSFRCVLVEVWFPHAHNSSLGSLQFDCFPVALSGELHIKAFTSPSYESVPVLKHTHHGPNCGWSNAKDMIRLCQVPRLEVFSGAEEAVLQVWDFPAQQHFHLWLYLNQTDGRKGMDSCKLLTRPENVSVPLHVVFPCLCLQIWPEAEDPPRIDLCPFARDAKALARAWAMSHLELRIFRGTLSLSLSAPCDLPGVVVPCWRMDHRACYPLHSRLHLTLSPNMLQEFPGLRPHPNLCVQVMSNGSIYHQSCLQEDFPGSQQQLLLWETVGPQGNLSLHVLERGSWVPTAQAFSTRNWNLREALQNDMKSGECVQVWGSEDGETDVLWACSLEKYGRAYWGLAWMVTLLGVISILLVLVLKKETLKGWLRILKEDYSSGGTLQGRPVLILYSPDNGSFERLVGILAAALAQLQVSVSLELWRRGELGALGPMQWLHAQKHRVLKDGGAIVLLFSQGAVASCAEWLGWEEAGMQPPVHPDSTFLASLNCVMPDFLAGKARDSYMVACFEELLPAAEIPGLFHSVPVYQLPSQLFHFLLALAGPRVGHEQRSSLRRQVVWIGKSLERAVEECRLKKPSWQQTSQLGDAQMKGASSCPCAES
ncbi:interleukin-17 receptor C [Heteronotia binoei]|uniref:interleukin-17 receptor C n=1 Tax=Heteronotia binoei TaxID=13085 RepID=UPI002931B068|nr:interleukin-17 receptor C [Heteronotia binoei]